MMMVKKKNASIAQTVCLIRLLVNRLMQLRDWDMLALLVDRSALWLVLLYQEADQEPGGCLDVHKQSNGK
jgi:hypothetical protein